MDKKEANRRYYEKIKNDPELLKMHRERATNYYKKNRDLVRSKMKEKLKTKGEKEKRKALNSAYRKNKPEFLKKVEKNFLEKIATQDNRMIDRIKDIRERAGFTQKQFAEMLNITPTHYGRIENKKRRLTKSLFHKILPVLRKYGFSEA